MPTVGTAAIRFGGPDDLKSASGGAVFRSGRSGNLNRRYEIIHAESFTSKNVYETPIDNSLKMLFNHFVLVTFTINNYIEEIAQ